MKARPPSDLAAFVLRLLMDGTAAPGDGDRMQWEVLCSLAKRNRVLVRVADQLERTGIRTPDFFADVAARERQRAQELTLVIGALATTCAELGIGHLFPKALQHLPDMGSDVDLLVDSESACVDAAILRGLPASPAKTSLSNRVAGARTYRLGPSHVVDIHHGRLGLLGEHTAYPRVLLRSGLDSEIGGVRCRVPSHEDQLVLQGLQQVFGRRSIRLADVLLTMSSIRGGALDWDRVIRTAREHDAFRGLSCYLAYVEQIHSHVFGSPLLAPEMRHQLALAGWGRVEFRSNGYRFPMAWASGRIYLAKLGRELAVRHWNTVARLSLAPALAVAAVVTRARRREGSVTGRDSAGVVNEAVGTR